MALNSIILSYNNINEIEENDSISPPSTSYLDKAKTIPNLSTSKYKKHIFQTSLLLYKSKSYQSLYNKFIFIKNEQKRNSFDNINIEMKNINIDKEKNNNNEISPIKNEYSNSNNINNKKMDYDILKNFKLYKPESDRLNNINLFQKINNINENNLNLNKSEDSEENININIDSYNNFHHKKIFKKNINKSNFLLNNKIIKMSKLLIKKNKDKFNEKPKENNPKIINTNKNLGLTNTSSYFYKKSSLYNIIAKPYIKKIINDPINHKIINKNELNNNNNYKICTFQTSNLTTNKKRQLILNINLKNKTNTPHLKISQFKKILKKDGILNILKFLDYYDIINIFNTKNKKIFILFNKALEISYYIRIKQYFLKYNNILELLNCKIVNIKVKDSLKIDLIANIRFTKGNYKYKINKKKKEKYKINSIEPLYVQLIIVRK